jgi:hypothetical protein
MIHGMHNEPWRKRLLQGESRLRLVKNTYGRVSWVRSEPGSMRRLPVLCWWPWPTCRMTWGRFRRTLELYRGGSHIVVGSRYMKGGRLIGGLPSPGHGFTQRLVLSA